jgi:hypothetical protein
MDALLLAKLFPCAFFAACFLQSGVDKVADRQGNLAWLGPHFEKTPFKGMVPLMLSGITLLELSAGLTSLASVIVLLVHGPEVVPVVSMGLVCLTLLMLFTGQRLAKDYAGAGVLAAYSAVALIGMVVVGIYRLP